MNTGPEIDMSRLENSETEMSIRDETRLLLQEAMSLVEMAKGTEKEEDFVREYGELADEFNARFEDGIIDHGDLGALRSELDEVRLSRNIGWRERKFLNRINTTNDRIIAGGEPELINELNEYRDQLTRWGIGTALSNQQQAAFLVMIDDIEADSSNNILNRLLNLTHFIKQLTTALDESWTGSTAMNTFYTGDFNETHDYSTRQIVREALQSSNNGDTFVSYDKEGNKGYEVKTGSPDITNPMEVGTYLCSLNKSGNLNKANLLENNLFSPTELFDLIEDYKSGAFGGPEVQGLFIGYLEGFEDNMNAIAVDYLANEQNGSHVVDFYNAKYRSGNTHPLYGPDNIASLTEKTIDIDISSIEDIELRQELMLQRRLQLGESLKVQILDVYAGGPEIGHVLGSIIDDQIRGENNMLGFSAVNQIISEYNRGLDENDSPFPLIDGGIKSTIDSTLASFGEAQMQAEGFIQSLAILEQIRAQANEKNAELQNLINAIIATTDEDRRIELAREIDLLKSVSYGLSEEITNAEEKAEEARVLAEESVNDSEQSVRSFIDYLSIFQVRSNEEILKDPKMLIGTIREKSDLLHIFEEMNNDINNAKLFIDYADIHPELQKDIDIVNLFPYNFSSADLFALPQNLFETHENLSILIKKSFGSRSYSGKMIDLILRRFTSNHTSEDAVKAVLAVIGNEGFSSQERQLITSNIPNSIIRADTGNLFGFKDSYEKTQVISEEQFESLVTKLENSQLLGLSERTQFDEFLEQSSLWVNMDAARLFIQAGYLGNSSFLKFELEEYSKKAQTDAELMLGFDLHTEALKQNMGNIQYFGRSLRSNHDVIEAVAKNLIEGGNFSNQYFNYLLIEDFQQLYKLFSSLKDNSSEDEAKKIIASNPKHYSTIIEQLNSGNLEEGNKVILEDIISIYKELDQESTNAKNNINNSGETIEEGGEIEQALLQKISEDFGINLSSITESETLKKILLNNESPDNYDFRIFIELCGDDQEKAQKLLEFVAQLNIEKLIEDNSSLEGQINAIGIADGNTEQYNNLFEGGKLDIDSLGRKIIQLNQDNPISEGEGEDEYAQRIHNIFVTGSGLNENQVVLMQSFLENHSKINQWITVRNNAPEIITSPPEDVKDIIDNNTRARRDAGLSPIASEQEVSGEVIFNPESGILETNPNYIPPQETPETKEKDTNTELPSPLSDSVSQSAEILGTNENPILKYGDNQVAITPEEANGMKNNPEAISNFINADKYFSSIGMESIWRIFRKEIVLAMNMSGGDIQINLNDDSLGELEFIKFAQFTYKIANGVDSSPSDRVNELQNQFYVYGDIHAEDKSLLGDRFITDLNTLKINKELTSGQIAARFSELANGEGLSNEVANL